MHIPEVVTWFDPDTFTGTHLAICNETRQCAIIDSVLDYDAASGRTRSLSADKVIEFVGSRGLQVQWIIETHAHADHLSAAPYLQQQLGGKIGIGSYITQVQQTFAKVFNSGSDFALDGRQFDHLFEDNETYRVGTIEARAFRTPGHTPACMTHLIGDAAFVGDTLFMPDYGTARCDFPGGDAAVLYDSVQKIFALPDGTRIFLCHDYLPDGRDHYILETTVGQQKQQNIHLREGIGKDEFVSMRQQRDAGLDMPRLILPSVQVNMRAGRFPEQESNGVCYLKIPLNML